MSGNCFIDTNILVYANDLSAGRRHQVAHELINACWTAGSGRISIQVLNEFFVTVTRKLSPGMAPDKAWEQCVLLCAWNPIGLDAPLMEEGWRIHRRYQFSWWDSLIVAAALLSQCETLYSEDLAAGQVIEGLRICNPFHGR